MYEVKQLDLTGITPASKDNLLVDPHRRVAEIFAMDLPAGAAFSLKLGQSNPFIPISRPFTMEPQGEQESNDGVYWRNDVAQVGVIVSLVIVYGSGADQLNPILT